MDGAPRDELLAASRGCYPWATGGGSPHSVNGRPWMDYIHRLCWRALGWGVIPVLVLATLALAACQGTGGSTPVRIATPTTQVTPEASREAPIETGTLVEQREDRVGPTRPIVRTPEAREPGVTLDRIVYVNSTGDLFTINPDGSGLRSLTAGVQASSGAAGRVMAQPLNLDRFHAWPTWSPDGSKLAVSRVQAVDGGSQITLEIVDMSTAQARTVYENTLGGLVAQGAPHYIYWSPGGRYLSFLASTADGLALFVKDTEDSAEAVRVSVGAPLYWNWRRDESALLLHNGTELELAEAPFQQESRRLLSSAAPFRVPAISPDGTHFAFIRLEEEGASLVVAPLEAPDDGKKLLDVGPLSAFAWSPDGTEIAVADQQNARSAVYQRLLVVSATDVSQVRVIVDDTILSFFWSPQGDRLAWVALDVENRSFAWTAADTSGDSVNRLLNRLLKFQPSTDVFTMLNYFDQYAYSHSPWSPDGTRLVVAGTPEGAARPGNGQSATRDRIFVLDAAGENPPLDIAAGTLAFWSWN